MFVFGSNVVAGEGRVGIIEIFSTPAISCSEHRGESDENDELRPAPIDLCSTLQKS
jgi:hypothetical protein